MTRLPTVKMALAKAKGVKQQTRLMWWPRKRTLSLGGTGAGGLASGALCRSHQSSPCGLLGTDGEWRKEKCHMNQGSVLK